MALHITTKGCYGLRAMAELAAHDAGELTLMSLVAERTGVSEKYLHALLTSLKNAGLVRSLRGSGGGFSVTRPSSEIKVSEILEALEGQLTVRACVVDAGSCERSGGCGARRVWTGLERVIAQYLSGLTLADVVANPSSILPPSPES